MSQLEEFKELCTNKAIQSELFNLLAGIIQDQIDLLGINSLDADTAIEKLKEITIKWSDAKFSYLLIHSCYIPDYYPETGSQETLFSKLVEYLVSEWGQRLGYSSELQTQKSTKEDVKFYNGNDVIVCDVKSNRLGRSQKSPNVKDVIKKSEYKTWLDFYSNKNKVGGFVTFPSLMEWSKGSTIHTYVTDRRNPIMLIYSEYLAFMLLKKHKNSRLLFDMLSNYSRFFPRRILDKKRAKQKYQKMILKQLKMLQDDDKEFDEFLILAKEIVKDYVYYSIKTLEGIIRENNRLIKKEVTQFSVATLRKKYVELKINILNREYESDLPPFLGPPSKRVFMLIFPQIH